MSDGKGTSFHAKTWLKRWQDLGEAIRIFHILTTFIVILYGIVYFLGYLSAQNDILSIPPAEWLWRLMQEIRQTDILYIILADILPTVILFPLIMDAAFLVTRVIINLFTEQDNLNKIAILTAGISNTIIEIIRSIIDIILGSILEILEYIRMVPGFVIAMRDMLLNEEHDDDSY